MNRGADLEYVLKQQEEVNASGNYSTWSPPTRDFRADNVARGGMRQRNSNRAYVAQDDEKLDAEQPAEIDRDVDENDVALQGLSTAIQDAQISDNTNGTFLSREDQIHEVYRIMNNCFRPPLPPEPEGKPEFKLNPGERIIVNRKDVVCYIHGAVNNFRTEILLGTGTTVSMIRLDLARRLKIKLNSQKRIKVSGLGGVPR
ncbi:Aspartic protease [Phytophthora megakarya]|uniref:Aspartic protease n=1 Tax=Phytophthora megakarya TaxID=4795 RepID=A0A225WKQ2_9STRA|nr:Aspartic protease [Phytophthora megakarya]